MAKEYTLIYFKKTGCPHCTNFDNSGIFSKLEADIAEQNYPIDTALIDLNPTPENKALIEKNIEKYGEEYNKFTDKFKKVPTLVLFYKKGLSLSDDSKASGSFLLPSSPVSVLKYFPIRHYEGKDYLKSEVILTDINNKIGIIKDKGLQKKYLKYKYKYLELKNKYLQ